MKRTALRFISLILTATVTLTLAFTAPGLSASNALADSDSDGSDNGDNYRVVVSIGDSYSAGEGVDPFYGQDEDDDVKINDPDWLAHRSQLAWPGQLDLPGNDGLTNEYRGSRWFFAASSGANIRDIAGYYDSDGEFGGQYRNYYYNGSRGTVRLDPQLDIFDQLDPEHPADYVTLTLGGNDVGFRSMLTTIALTVGPLDFGVQERAVEDIREEFYHTDDNGNEDGIREQLRQAYYAIAEEAGPQATIIVVGYPKLLSPDGNVVFDKTECELINDAAEWLNDEIEALVNECHDDGLNICFVSVEEAFEGHGAYSDDPYIISISISNNEDLKPGISAGSMHPNAAGIDAYRRCVQAKIDELEFEKAIEHMSDGQIWIHNITYSAYSLIESLL